MAINTEDRRRSVVGILPIADGTISGVDKQHVAGFYRGIAVTTPWTKIIIQGIDALSGELVIINGKYRLP